MKTINGLAINGGGVYGVMAIKQLIYLYELLGHDVFFKHFDYIAGSSTGALVCALIAKGYKPHEILRIYVDNIPKIFKKRCLRTLLGKSKYDNEYITDLAYRLIGDVTLGDLKQKIIIPAYNADDDVCKIFKSSDPKDAHHKLADVIIASSSAPIYFPAFEIEGKFYKDGGLAVNNPSLITVMEAMSQGADKINLLNITTGAKPVSTTKSERKGNILSAIEMINEILYTQDITTKGTIDFMYKHGIVVGSNIRCEAIRKNCSGDIDDASARNIKAMLEDGELSVAANESLLKLYAVNSLKAHKNY